MSEKALVTVLEHILEEIKKFNANQLVFMAFLESKVPSLEDNTRVEESIEKIGDMIQDFKGVTVMLETDKAYLVVKNGYQRWVAKSHLTADYELGSNVDLELTDSALKWVPEKPWEKYIPQKKGG